ncbi:MAG TPA: hypothetical protein DEH78_09535 [Solibacterales bacterium]|nr:hypothetical protein [Bryobacterales bacterium]
MVNFQSFNSYLADGIGCTTFSFALNLGVFLVGCASDSLVKRDAGGLARPQEYECPFRVHLQKRTPVDGFARADIFYVAPDGGTMAPVLREAIWLLEEQAPPWFKAFEDLDSVVIAMSEHGPPAKGTESLGLGASGAPGSYSDCDLLASLQVQRHTQSPELVSSSSCVHAIDNAVGAMLHIFAPGFATPIEVEQGTYRIRDLLARLEGSLPVPDDQLAVFPTACQLFGSNWSTRPIAPSSAMEAEAFSIVTPRDHLWPQLRIDGFVEFTDRLAHRQTGDAVEVVAFVPMDPVERLTNRYPAGLFHLALGVFWPGIAQQEGARRNRRGEFRPQHRECHLQAWLMPATRAPFGGPTCFSTAEAALKSLRNDAEQWFALCRNGETLAQLLDEPDWKILVRLPTMRGHGSPRSVQRSLLRLALCRQSSEGRVALLKAAHEAVNHHFEGQRPHFRKWVETVESRHTKGN